MTKPIFFDTSFQTFVGRPKLQDHGLHSASLISGWGFFRTLPDGSYDFSHIDMETCRRAANHPEWWKGREADIIVLDEESLPVQTDDRCHRDHIHDQLIECVQIYREAHPGCAIGFYAMMPEDSFYAPLGNSGLARWAHYKPDYDKWVEHNKRFLTNIDDQTLEANNRGLASYVDRVFPACYVHLKLPDTMEDWKVSTDGVVKEAAKYGKPVIAYLCPQLQDRKAGFPYIPKGCWREILEHTLANPAVDGVCVYQSVLVDTKWNPNADWWQETLQVVKNSR